MESILDSLTAEKLYPSGGTNLLDLEELSDGDFLTNVVSSRACGVQLARLSFASRCCHLCEYSRVAINYPGVLFLFLLEVSCLHLKSLKSNAHLPPVPPGAGPQEGGVVIRS